MKSELSALELYHLVKELQLLKDGKLDKIYQPSKTELLLQMHIPRDGKKILDISLPGSLFITSQKHDITPTPPPFCVYLRKKLGNARLRSIAQHELERIMLLEFSTKDETFFMVIELFDRGNIILTNSEKKVLSAVIYRKWKDRTVRPGITYELPKALVDPRKITKQQLQQLISDNPDMEIVKLIATRLGLGGLFAEEVLFSAGIDKDNKELNDSKLSKLTKGIKQLFTKDTEPLVIYSDSDKKQIKEVLPFPLNSIEHEFFDKIKSFNEAIERLMLQEIKQSQESLSISKHEKHVDKLKKMLLKQQEMKDNFEKEITDNTRKGELIYENYQLISEVIDEIKKAREKLSWKEIKKRLKGHKLIKEIDEKSGSIVVEIKD